MRSVDLAKVALAAEALRLRRFARRQAFRAVYAAVGAVFLLAVFTGLHVLLWMFLLRWLSPLLSVVCVIGVDVVLGGIMIGLAVGGGRDAAEEEAREIKEQAVAELKRSLTLMGIVAQTTGLAFRMRTRAGARRGAASIASGLVSRLIGR